MHIEYSPEIMTWEQYAKSEHEVPYVFELKKGDKELSYFGANHTSDPNDPMFAQIKSKFFEVKPDSVFVEGMEQLEDLKNNPEKWSAGVLYIKSLSDEDVIRKYGEPGLGLKLAIEAGIEFYSPEPKTSEEIKNLLEKGFTREEIFADYVYRQVYQYYRDRENIGMSIEEYLQSGIIETIKENTDWEDFDYSVENLERVGGEIWGDKGSIFESEYAHERTNPTPSDSSFKSRITLVSQESSYYRDIYMVKKIKEALTLHNKPFVIFGASHAYMQRPALEKMFAEM